MEIHTILQGKKLWEIKVEFSNHCQMRWMDRKIPSKALNAMIKRAINYCFSKRRMLKKRIVIRHFKRKASIVVAMTYYDAKKANMAILVVTMIRAIMRTSPGETIIDLLENGREVIYDENSAKTKNREEKTVELGRSTSMDKPCS